MVERRSRIIPGLTHGAVTRGGGAESIEYVTNGPLLILRNFTYYKSGHGIHPGGSGLSSNIGVPTFISGSSLLSGDASTDSQVKALGATAIGRSRPNPPATSILTSAGEIYADGIPLLPRVESWRKETLKALAGAHLSVQFGFLPIIADIQAYAKQVRDYENVMKKSKDLSKVEVLKVGYSFPVDTETVTSENNVVTRDWATGNSVGDPGRAYVTQTRFKKSWFEGKYHTFFAPALTQRNSEYAKYADLLLGTELTPEVVWNLAPWSWAVDWFTNVGDIIATTSATIADGLVLHDAFMMSHHRKVTTVVRPGVVLHSTKKIPYWSGGEETTQVTETKKRFRAAPYFGFGSVGDLTNRQISILAALGITTRR